LFAMLVSATALPLVAQSRPLIMASTPDVGAIAISVAGDAADVRAIMPAGADVHSFAVSSEQVRNLQRALVVVLANSRDLGFEQTIKGALGKTPSLDWPDYVAQGATLRDYPDYPQNPHGPWLRLDNAGAMARAMAAQFIRLGLPKAVIEANLRDFERELAAQQTMFTALAAQYALRDKPLLVVIPGLCDMIANLGLPVGAVLMAEGSGTVSGQCLTDAVTRLRSKQLGGIVCPLSMRLSRQGEAARQVAADSGAAIAYVRFQDTDLQTDTYLSVSAYNAAAIVTLGAGGAQAPAVASEQPWLLPAIVSIIALLIGLVFGATIGKRLRQTCGAGIFDEKPQ